MIREDMSQRKNSVPSPILLKFAVHKTHAYQENSIATQLHVCLALRHHRLYEKVPAPTNDLCC